MIALRRIALQAPDAIQDSVRAGYQGATITSITALQAAQPVRKASERLMPVEGIPNHTIAEVLRILHEDLESPPAGSPHAGGQVPLQAVSVSRPAW